MEVTPCRTKLCAFPSCTIDVSEWLWMSMNPGATVNPVASMVRPAVFPASFPMAAIFPWRIPRSPIKLGLPAPSTILPPRITTSKSCADPTAAASTRSSPNFIEAILKHSGQRCSSSGYNVPGTQVKLLICVLPLVGVLGIAADNAPFSKSVYPVFEEAACRGCHISDGVASGTRLHFPEPSAPADRIEAFGQSLVVLVDQKTPENSLLLRKPTARIPHAGGQRIKPGSPEEAALRAWIDRLAQLKGADLAKALQYREDEGAEQSHVALRLLTHTQYNNTVRDLLGDRSLPANQFPPEDFVNGFKNQYAAENLSPLLEDAYSAAAEKLAANAFRRNARALVSCQPSPACRAEFIQSFGLKAFRRPLDAAEIARYQKLFQKQSDFMAGAQLVVEAMLQ